MSLGEEEHRPEFSQAEEHGQEFFQWKKLMRGSDTDVGENKDTAESSGLHKCDVS
jgi:hypothetical protein